MEELNITSTNNQPAFSLTRKIGNTTYELNAFCQPEGNDNFEDRLMRVIRFALLDFFGNCDIIGVPQMDRMSGRSA